MVKPAVDGTLAVMKACTASKVKRCVITSSISACQNPASTDKPADRVFNESHWSNPDRPEGLGLYHVSETKAERAAWDYQASLPEAERFDIVTILPGFVNGPPLRKESFASGEFVKNLMNGNMKEISSDGIGAVDVRDVALAHI